MTLLTELFQQPLILGLALLFMAGIWGMAALVMSLIYRSEPRQPIQPVSPPPPPAATMPPHPPQPDRRMGYMNGPALYFHPMDYPSDPYAMDSVHPQQRYDPNYAFASGGGYAPVAAPRRRPTSQPIDVRASAQEFGQARAEREILAGQLARLRREMTDHRDQMVEAVSLLKNESLALNARQRAAEVDVHNFRNKEKDLEKWRDVIEEERGKRPSLSPLEEQLESIKEKENESRLAYVTQEERQKRYRQRLDRRLARWRDAWQKKVGVQKENGKSNLEKIEQQKEQLNQVVEQEKKQVDVTLKKVAKRREELAEIEKRFQREVVNPWEMEKRKHEHQAEMLRQQCSSLEKETQAFNQKREQERIKFQETMQKSKAWVRDHQEEWQQEVSALRTSFDQERTDLEKVVKQQHEEIDSLRQNNAHILSTEKAALVAAESEQKMILNALSEKIGVEKSTWEKDIARWQDRFSKVSSIHEEALKTLRSEVAAFDSESIQHKTWMRNRYRTLDAALQNLHERTSSTLKTLKEEKDRLTNLLESEKTQFLSEQKDMETHYNQKHQALIDMKNKWTTEHDTAREQARIHQENLEQEIQKIHSSVEEIQKKQDVLRDKYAERLYRRREKYEKVLLKLQHRIDQESISQEEKLAQERMALKTLNERIAKRRQRIEKIRERRQAALESVFQNAQQAAVAAQDAQIKEAALWNERMTELLSQKVERENKKAELVSDPQRYYDQAKRSEKLEDKKFESEKTRLASQGKDQQQSFKKDIREYRESLARAIDVLREHDNDLSHQEADLRSFLSTVNGQILQLNHLEDFFRSETITPHDLSTRR